MFAKRIDRLTGSLIREILQLTQKPEVISFAGGLPAAEVMPAMDFSAAPPGIGQYGPSEGEPRLRSLIADQLQAIGRDCTTGQVLVTAGSQQGVDLVSKLYIDEGTTVVLESPTFLGAAQSFKLFGARFEGLTLPPDGINPETLRETIARHKPAFVYLIPNFQNPTGYCYSHEHRLQIARVLDETNTPLVEDDPYRELVYETVDRSPICSYLKTAPWIYLGSFSKIANPGLRIGYLACSPELYPLFVRLKQSADLHTNRIGQWWLAEFISNPEYQDHLARLRRYYKTQRDLMQHALQIHFSDLAAWEVPAGGLFFWLRLIRPQDTRRMLQHALERNIAFMPGEPFFVEDQEKISAIRLNFSHATPERIEQGIAVLAEVVRQTIDHQQYDNGNRFPGK